MSEIAEEIAVAITAEFQGLQAALGAATAELQEFGASVAGAMSEAAASLTTIEGGAEKAGAALNSMGEAVMGAFAVDQIVKLGTATGEAAAQLENLSQITGLSTSSLSQMKFAATELSVSWDSVSIGLERLARTMKTAEQGGKMQAEALAEVGITSDDLHDKSFTLDDALMRISDSFVHMGEGQERAAVAMQLFSRGGDAIIPFLDKGSAGLQALYEKSNQLGVTWGGADVDAAAKLNEKLKDMESQWSVIGRDVGEFVLPIFIDAGQAVRSLGDDIGTWLAKLRGGTGNADDQLGALQAKLNGLQVTLQDGITRQGWTKDSEIVSEFQAKILSVQNQIIQLKQSVKETTGTYPGSQAAAPIQAAPVTITDDPEVTAKELKLEHLKELNGKQLDEEGRYFQELDQVDTDGALRDLDQQEAALRQKAALGTISHQEEYQGLIALEDQKYQLQLAELQREIGLHAQDLTAETELLRKKEELIKQHQAAVDKIQNEMAADSIQRWKDMLAPINSAVSASVDGIIRGTTTGKQALANIGMSIVDEFVARGVKVVTDWVATEAAQTTATEAGTASRVATQAAAAVETKGITTTSAMSSIASYAAVAAAASYASVAAIPFIGWAMAPGVAVGAYMDAMSYEGLAAAAGGMEVDEEQLIHAHEREMVLPADLSDGLRKLIRGGGGSGQGVTYLSALDPRSFKDLLRRNPAALTDAARAAAARNFRA